MGDFESLHKMWSFPLILLWPRFLSYGNQSTNLQSKAIDWFLFDRNLRHQWLKEFFGKCQQIGSFLWIFPLKRTNWTWFHKTFELCNVITKNLTFSTNRKLILISWKQKRITHIRSSSKKVVGNQKISSKYHN